MTHLKYAADVRQLQQAISEKLISSFDEALNQLSKLIFAVERKLSDHGKSKPGVSFKEDSENYVIDPTDEV